MNADELRTKLAIVEKRCDNLVKALDTVRIHLETGNPIRDLFLSSTLNVINQALKGAYDNIAYSITSDEPSDSIEKGKKAIDSL